MGGLNFTGFSDTSWSYEGEAETEDKQGTYAEDEDFEDVHEGVNCTGFSDTSWPHEGEAEAEDNKGTYAEVLAFFDRHVDLKILAEEKERHIVWIVTTKS